MPRLQAPTKVRKLAATRAQHARARPQTQGWAHRWGSGHTDEGVGTCTKG